MRIPVNRPLFHGNEPEYIRECLETGWISSEGPYVGELEKKFAEKIGRRYGIAVSSGSGALDIAVEALGLGPGDEVILPTFTIISPAFSVVRAGATPVLADSDPLTWNMDVEEVRKKITVRTKAVIAVHIYGLPVDLDPLVELCREHDLLLIEDAAEMHGQSYRGLPCGSFGDISTFSFYPNKLMTTGEGGLLVCNDEELATKCRKFRNLGFEEQGRRFVHHQMGWNYRMTNLQAALGLAQMDFWEAHLQRKKQIGLRYRQAFEGHDALTLQPAKTDYAENVYWVFGLVVQSEERAERLTRELAARGIGTRPFFWCMHEQPVFLAKEMFRDEHYPVAEQLARRGFYLPSGLGITDHEIDEVIQAVLSIE